ncbi:class I SAM-dependent methyltransferase [Luethyella okanaganae]|uniref:Class I SAM-dependent methyltransferase n=1 Tax=Luethyella okanaganae TaxID=69372 RepID=A0ABW1VGB4_9MICO
MRDHYEELAEFHDLFMDGPWNRIRPALADAFSRVGVSERILDLGAGTGIGSRILAACTAARIVAVEPSHVMRAVLTARIADDPALASRVSIIAGRLPDALETMKAPFAGFVCAHMLGHLSADDREATFRHLAKILRPRACGIITIEPGRDPAEPEAELVQERRIGDYRYIARYLPSSETHRYVSEYTVLDGDQVLRSERFAGDWEALPLATLNAELSQVGLRAERGFPGTALVRRIDEVDP